MSKPECCNKQSVEIQSGRVTSVGESSRYSVRFCTECGQCRVTGFYNNESFAIRFSINPKLMYTALNNAYQKAKDEKINV